MADLKVPNLDDAIASALRARAQANGVSLEEEVRRTLAASVVAGREELVRRRRRCTPPPAGTRQRADIRAERDGWG